MNRMFILARKLTLLIFFFQYEMIGKEYPLEGMEPYDQEDAIKVQEKLIGMGIPAVLAEF